MTEFLLFIEAGGILKHFNLHDLQLSQFNQTLTLSLDDKTFRALAKLQEEALKELQADL